MVTIHSLIRVKGETDAQWPTYCFLFNHNWWNYTGFRLVPMEAAPTGDEMLDTLPVKRPVFCDGISCDGETLVCRLADGGGIALVITFICHTPLVSSPVVKYVDREDLGDWEFAPDEALDLRQF